MIFVVKAEVQYVQCVGHCRNRRGMLEALPAFHLNYCINTTTYYITNFVDRSPDLGATWGGATGIVGYPPQMPRTDQALIKKSAKKRGHVAKIGKYSTIESRYNLCSTILSGHHIRFYPERYWVAPFEEG